MRTTTRLLDLVARYGGEEFVILLPETEVDQAISFSKRLTKRIAAETWEHEPVTVSIGMAALNDLLLNGFQLVSMADKALYAAKRAGKNRVTVHGAEFTDLKLLKFSCVAKVFGSCTDKVIRSSRWKLYAYKLYENSK